MNSISKASEQVKSIFNGQVKNNQGTLRNKNLSNKVDPLDGLLPADKERLRQREARIQREIQDIQKQLQTDIDLVKSPKVVNSGRLSNMGAQMKQTLVSAKEQIVKTVNSTDVSKIQGGLKDSFISAKEHIMGDSVHTEPLKTEKTEKTESVTSSSELMSNIGDKVKSGLVFAQDALKSSNITENLQGGFVSAKDTLLSAKDRMFGTVQPIEGGMPGRNHPHPERFAAQSSGLVSKITGNLFAVKDRFMGSSVEPMEGGMPGRNHPHPERFEVQAPGLVTKIGDIMSANSGLATKINDNFQGGLIFAKDGLSSAKDRILGTTIQPIEGGMPGRNHPHPEQFAVQNSGLINNISTNLQGGFEFAKGGLVSAKSRFFGSTIQPIEGGMPGRNHPHPERFEDKAPGLVTKISENIPTGLISAINDNLQGGFATAKDGLLSARTKIWGPSIQPIEGGMPGRNHPHPERFEAKTGLVTKISDSIPTGFISTINENLQGGFATAQGAVLSAKTKVWGSSIQPIEGGMPGRNHPHPERFEAKTSFVTKISENIPTGFISAITDPLQGGFTTAKDSFLSAKTKVWGSSIQPIEGGMPGRYHPHPERFEVKSSGFVSKITENVQVGFVSAKGGLLSAKNKVWGSSIQPIEGGMPGRNHPHPERFVAKDQGFVSKLTDNLQGGFVSAKGGLVSAKNKIWGQTIQPIEGGMPGRNHPHPERFEVKNPGIVAKLTDNVQGGFVSAKSGFVSAKNKIWGPTIQPIEGGMPGRNHPNAERFKVKDQGIVNKLTDNIQGGFVSAKNKIWGQTMLPIESGMPGRNHPHPERFEAKNPGIVSKLADNFQGGFVSAKGGLVSAKNKIWGQNIQPIEGGMPGRNHPNAKRFEAKDSGIMSKFTDNVQGGLVSAKNKIWGPTIQPIEGGMPGRNHPNAERFEAKNPGIVSKLTDNVQGGLISAKNKIWGPTIVSVEGGMPGRNHPHAEKFEANDDEEDETFALQPTKGSRIEKDSIDQVSPIQKIETANKNQTEPKLSKLVSESKLAELFDMEPETETEIGIVDQTALEPSSDIVEDNMEQPTEANHAESPKPLGFFEKLKSLF